MTDERTISYALRAPDRLIGLQWIRAWLTHSAAEAASSGPCFG